MALLSIEDELARSRDAVPFSNGYEFDCWSSIWCAECVHYDTCPLLLVILHEKTPASWEDREPTALNRYTCHEYRDKDDQGETCTGNTESSLAPTASPDASPSPRVGPRTSTSLSPEDINLRSSTPH